MWQIDYPVVNLVARHRGTLPVIIGCPHGGEAAPSGVPERSSKTTPAGCDFEKSRDLHTKDIAVGVAQRMLELFGEAPYVVIADFHRKFIDANRSRDCAFETAAAAPFYDEYHDTLRAFVDEIRAETGGLGLLFDIHGTAGIKADPADIYLGTANGETVSRLRAADPNVLFRRRSLRGFLEAAGHVVSPRQPGVPENPALSGGFTVRHYGSSHADGLDAFQLEIAPPLRSNTDQRDALIEVLAHAFGNLANRYADGHTISAMQRVDLLSGGTNVDVTGRLQRFADSRDAGLRVGGAARYRGRVEIRHDGDASGRAGVLVLYDERGRDHYVWIDTQGKLRVSQSDPGVDSEAGVVVGRQT
jgi:N-formylglutamate amidohydrolase